MAHIHFKWVRWKNLFSYGDTWTTVQLDRSPSTLVIGKNGHGKSVFYEALHIGLFGVPIRKLPKKNLVVSDKNNKGMLIEVCFQIGDDEYIVRRGQKPDIFEIDLNGEGLDREASVKDMQNKLNRDILKSDKIGFQITTQISKSSEIQMFMSLDAANRRKFVDNMLESFIFTEMAKLHKSSYDVLKTQLQESSLKLARIEASTDGKAEELESAREMLATMETRRIENIDREIAMRREMNDKRHLSSMDKDGALDELQRNLENIAAKAVASRRKASAMRKKYDGLPVPVLDVDKAARQQREMNIRAIKDEAVQARRAGDAKIKELDELRLDARAKMKSHEASIASLNAGFCDACRQEVTEEHVAEERAKVDAKVSKLSAVIADMDAKRLRIIAKTEATIAEITEREAAIQGEHDEESERIRAFDGVLRDHKDKEREVLDQEAAADRLESEQARIERDIARVQKEKAEIETAIDAENAEIRRLTEARETRANDPEAAAKVAELAAQLAKMRDDMAERKSQHDAMGVRAEYSELMSKMLKDSGIKTVIVRKYLPIINRVVNEKLAELGFFAKFTMDENFDETIMYNGVTERVFNQFSEGQKLRINIALILAWREIARLQGRMSSNLLMFDETLDVSLDDDGYESLTEIFNRMDNLNIFVISHNVQKMENFVRTKMRFEYVDGFSRLADVVDSEGMA